MIVVRLHRPRSDSALGFQRQFRRWIELSAVREIGKPLLRDVGMLVAFVWAERVQRFHTERADDSAEHIGLLEIKLN